MIVSVFSKYPWNLASSALVATFANPIVSNDFEGTLCSVSQNYRNENIKPELVNNCSGGTTPVEIVVPVK